MRIGRDLLVGGVVAAGALVLADGAAANDRVRFHERVIGTVDGYASDVAVARLNRDLRPDVAVAVERGVAEPGGVQTAVSRWCRLALRPFVAGGQTPYRVGTGDLDGDGDIDVVEPNTVSGDVSVFANDGAGGLTLAETLPAPYLTRGIAVGDLNGDRRPDLATSSTDDPDGVSSAALRVHYRSADNSGFDPPETVPPAGPEESFTPAETLQAVDVNGDGARDIVGVEQSRVLVSHRAADGEAFEPVRTAAYVEDGPFDVAAADLDGDGRTDLATANIFGPRVAVLLRRADNAGFEPPRYIDVGAPSAQIAIADFDGDRRRDIAASLLDTGRIALIRGVPGGFGPPRLVAAGPVPLALAAADMDVDGDADLVVGDRDSSEIRLLANRR
jgi:FG-GAP-like repeat